MLRHASAMHDIGKIGIPDRILLKPGKLDAQEWEVIKAHTVDRRRRSSPTPPTRSCRWRADRAHPPRALGRQRLPAGPEGRGRSRSPARICAVCDVYDALLSKRSYKESWTSEDALAEIARGAGSHFDPELSRAFLELAPQLTHELDAAATAAAAAEPASIEPVTA